MPSGLPEVKVTVQPPAKPWWKSRTLWLNAAVLTFAALEAGLQVLQPWMPVNVFAVVALALPVLNMVLRTVTTTAVSR